MARAGYDPRESTAFWERMASAGGGQPPEFLSTHPAHGTRIERLKQFMPKAIEAFERYGGQSSGGKTVTEPAKSKPAAPGRRTVGDLE